MLMTLSIEARSVTMLLRPQFTLATNSHWSGHFYAD